MASKQKQDIAQLDAQLERYLAQRVSEGDRYFKSRFIASDLDVSSKRIGTSMRRLADQSSVLDINTWGGDSDGTTWCIELSNVIRVSDQ